MKVVSVLITGTSRPARFLSPAESVKEGLEEERALQAGLEDGGPCHHGDCQPRIWFGCSIYLPWGSPKLGQVCTWEGNVSSCQLGDDAVTQKPRASVGKTRPRLVWSSIQRCFV